MLEAISRALAWLGGAIFLGCAGLVAVDVALRALFSQVTLYSVELTSYGIAVAVACGYGYALSTKAHIGINVVYRMLPAAGRAVLDLLAVLGIAVMAFALVWYALKLTLSSLDMGSPLDHVARDAALPAASAPQIVIDNRSPDAET